MVLETRITKYFVPSTGDFVGAHGVPTHALVLLSQKLRVSNELSGTVGTGLLE